MHVTDWFPTILDLAGGSMLGLQGLIGSLRLLGLLRMDDAGLG